MLLMSSKGNEGLCTGHACHPQALLAMPLLVRQSRDAAHRPAASRAHTISTPAMRASIQLFYPQPPASDLRGAVCACGAQAMAYIARTEARFRP